MQDGRGTVFLFRKVNRMKSKSFLPGACFLSALLTLPSVCHAIITGLCETDLPGLCSKSLDINASGSQITIVLSNTSPASNSGFITADAFNMPGNLGLTLASTTNANFQLSAGSIAVRPFPNTEFLLSADQQRLEWRGQSQRRYSGRGFSDVCLKHHRRDSH